MQVSEREVALDLVKRSGRHLQIIHAELRRDKTIVWHAVSKNYTAFFFAHDELQRD